LISLTLVGLFSIHATELITVGLLVLVAVLLRGETHVLRKWIQSREPLIISILSGLMLLPVVLAASGGASERSLDYQPVLNLSNTIGQYLLFSFSGFELPIAAVLCICGLMVARKYKKQVLAWSFVSLGIVIGLAAQFPTNRVLTIFTKPWYGQVLRLDYNVVYFAIPLISLAVVHLVELLMPREHPRLLNIRKLTAAVILIALFIPAASQSHAASQKLQESWYNGLIPVNQNSVAAFHWMKQNMEDDQFVMTDVDGVDGSTWMYALANVRPIMYGAITSDQRDKWRSIKFELLKSVGRLQENASLLQWVVTHKVKYFYFDERTNAISPNHTVTLPTLQSDSKLREVFSRENAHVFEFIN
jgi:hypothetical protein